MKTTDFWARQRALFAKEETMSEETETKTPKTCNWRNAPRPDGMLDEIELRSRGAIVTRGVAPAMRPPAEVMIWGQRFFVLSARRYEGPGPIPYEEALATALLPAPERAATLLGEEG